METTKIIYHIILWLFFLYSMGIFSVYTWIALFSYGAVLRYKHGNIFTDYSIIASNPNAPSFSLIAPAYNEGKTIVENVRSLLSLYYHKLEIIIVNDGSKDDSIERLVEAYQLEKVSYIIPGNLPTQEVIQVYKSKNPAFKKLIVVDKKNGGKADALNVGINISKSDYIVCIDVDCIIEQDAILKLAKPFMEQTDKRLIACGGAIRLANNCVVENGKVLEVNLPKSWIGRSQALEYIRAFVLGRMAWSRASGLILISGAFGAFDKEIVLACAGYDHKTVGEDMELVVRMRRYMIENNLPHQVINIPDPLCWTEVPEDKEILKKQRNRWMRGTMETLWKHRKLMFNPKYGKLGMISLPYWFFFEFLGPLVEFSGYVIFWLFLFMGLLNGTFFLSLFTLVVFSSVLYSIYAIFVDLLSHQVYSKRKDLTKLIVTAILEPFYFHPLVTWSGINGIKDFFGKKKAWGDMARKGFSQEADENFKEKALRYLKFILKELSSIALIFILLISIFTVVEYLIYSNSIQQFSNIVSFLVLLANNLLYGFSLLFIIIIIYSLLNLFSRTLSKSFILLTIATVLLAQLLLAFYFSESKNLLGPDLFFYSFEEFKNILQASGVLSLINIFLLLVSFFGLYFLIRWFWWKKSFSIKLVSFILILSILSISILSLFGEFKSAGANDFLETTERSKIGYFVKSNSEMVLNNWEDQLSINSNNQAYAKITSEYPFLVEDQTKDFLGPYFNYSKKTPNLVLIIVEGLGAAYSNPTGYIGDFTPFLSNLKTRSLVWENNLSSSGRTFSVLPTILGSLPFANSGFLELKVYPNHFNLINILAKNSFKTGFYYGGDAEFDFMKKYLTFNKINEILDQSNFPNTYQKLPSNSGESWGYEDQAVFDQLAKYPVDGSNPYFNIALTLSTHNPFLINNEPKYAKMFESNLSTQKMTKTQKDFAISNKKQLISVLNLDDALREFFEKYQKREDFDETIFIITGDHSMPEIPLQNKIDRYHVPLIIYSPLLKKHQKFNNIVSHFDIAPTILAFYKANYNMNIPEKVTWLGKGLDIGADKNAWGAPMMQSKSQLIDFVQGKIHINENKSFVLNNRLEEDESNNNQSSNTAIEDFNTFKKLNKKFASDLKLLPDSIYRSYFADKP
ncbi:sulfatase-like hydrolase/transferase [Sphingobacterium endophyticum]|uniref:sulfatase-like hydrolase/transferase n=1 Tax=Sphingobacterium endophyticum TaxID=2546448 RepID=UPI0012E28431|nr:sulfatase-like hydrolase/transferase [Sphingobacterium endophyticum]